METKEGKTVFIEYSTAEKGQHFMTVVQTMDHKRQIIGRIYREYDKEKGKSIYTANDWEGNPIFKDTHDLTSLKKKFIENGKTMAIAIPKVPHEPKHERHFFEKTGRFNELKKTREVKSPARNIEKGKDQIGKALKSEKDVKLDSRHASLVRDERERDVEQIRNSHQQPEAEKEQTDRETSEKSDREMELDQIRDDNEGRDQDLEMDL